MATYYVANYGANANNGTSPTTPWKDINFALGTASGTNPGLAAGDTVWIAPGTYREIVTYAGGNGTSGNPINIYGDPTFTKSWTTGSAGKIRITNFMTDSTLPTAGNTLSITKDWINVVDLCIDGYPSGSLSSNTASTASVFIAASNIAFTRCNINTVTSGRFVGIHHYLASGKTGLTLNNCSIFAPMSIWSYMANQGSTPYASGIRLVDCIVLGGGTIDGAYTFEAQTSGQFNDVQIYNNTILNWGTTALLFINAASSGTIIMRNNLIYSVKGTGVNSFQSITITQSNNFIIASTTYTNVSPTTNSITANLFDMGASRIQQFTSLPFLSHQVGSPIYQAGTSTGAPATDFYGKTWIGTPTVGGIEIQTDSNVGFYSPAERNASAITIAPASTSQSIELYLGATGLAFNTSGLAAYYVRNQSAPVAITLVTQTPTGAWTSGGFAEISSSLVPGVYRLDVPNAAFAANASDVTIVVRGASGTNGAVLTVTLSSGGLTAAQTAAAVWDEARASHVTAGTFGQYVNAELVTPVTSAALVRMGPFEVRADGLGASDPLDIQTGAQHGIDFQCVDNNNAGIDITSATVTAKVYNSGATLVDTYACTATYAADGRATFTIDTTVTNVPGTYTATITRTTGASDTQVFGPLRIYVRDI